MWLDHGAKVGFFKEGFNHEMLFMGNSLKLLSFLKNSQNNKSNNIKVLQNK